MRPRILRFEAAEPWHALDATAVDAAEMAAAQVAPAPDAPADDVVAFAKALAASGTKMYGAFWCPHCGTQKRTFEDGATYLPYVEVSNPDHTQNAVGNANSITSYPTWVFPDSTRLTGEQSLATLSQRSGVAIPQLVNPHIPELPPVTLLAGSPLHIPLDGYDPNGGPLTYEVTSDNSAVQATLLTGSRSIKLSVGGYGDMVFYLFEDKAPRATERIITLANQNFYNGVIFHRVINGFMIQGGDPTTTGGAPSNLPNFDDQFHNDLQHNRTGLLSMAKLGDNWSQSFSGDDTNGSQFFVIDTPLTGQSYPRHLDFNHSVFGQLVEGFSTLEAISQHQVGTASRPTYNITIDGTTVFNDIENGMLLLKADPGANRTANIMVTVRDAAGNSLTRTFAVSVTNDTVNGTPYLEDIPEVRTSVGTPVSFQVHSRDVEGDAVLYSGVTPANPPYMGSLDPATGVFTITPNAGFTGTTTLMVRVRAATGSSSVNGPFDTQQVRIVVKTPVAGDVDLDDRVGLQDLVRLRSNFGMTTGAQRTQGDLNGDGAVNKADLAELAKELGRKPASASVAISTRLAPAAVDRAIRIDRVERRPSSVRVAEQVVQSNREREMSAIRSRRVPRGDQSLVETPSLPANSATGSS